MVKKKKYENQHWLDQCLYYRCLPEAKKIYQRFKKVWDREASISFFSEVYLNVHKYIKDLPEIEQSKYIYSVYLVCLKKELSEVNKKDLLVVNNKIYEKHIYLIEDLNESTSYEKEEFTEKLIDYVRVSPINMFKSFDRTVFLKYYISPKISLRTLAEEYGVTTGKIDPAIKRFQRSLILTFTNYDMKESKTVKKGFETLALLVSKIESGYPWSSAQFRKHYMQATGKQFQWAYIPKQIKELVAELKEIMYEESKEISEVAMEDISKIDGITIYTEPLDNTVEPTELPEAEIKKPKKSKKKQNGEHTESAE